MKCKGKVYIVVLVSQCLGLTENPIQLFKKINIETKPKVKYKKREFIFLDPGCKWPILIVLL